MLCRQVKLSNKKSFWKRCVSSKLHTSNSRCSFLARIHINNSVLHFKASQLFSRKAEPLTRREEGNCMGDTMYINKASLFFILFALGMSFAAAAASPSPASASVLSFVPSDETMYYQSQWRPYRAVKARNRTIYAFNKYGKNSLRCSLYRLLPNKSRLCSMTCGNDNIIIFLTFYKK